jgi:oligopeptide/dipeptide ABC transporter ATP-binding protein
VQAQVVNLLLALQKELGLSYLFIAHDLGIVRHVSHRVAVMYLGELVEVAPTRRLFDAPAHPYTRSLLSAIPTRDPRRRGSRLVLTGDVPSPMNPPSGCRFHTRCPAVLDRCRSEWPEAVEVEQGHTVRCFHAVDLDTNRPWFPQISARIEQAQATNRSSKSTREVPARRQPVATRRSRGPQEVLDPDAPRKGAAPRVWLVAGTVGLMLVALGHALSGAMVAFAAFWFGFGRRAHRRGLATGALVLGLAASTLAATGFRRLERRWQAEGELASLGSQIEARAALAGAPPVALEDLGWRLFEVFDDGRAVDPWNRSWQYRVPGRRGAPFDLWSLGPDGVPSADDVATGAQRGDDSR